MDINCTYNCKHQTNGKCNLMDVEQPCVSNLASVLDPNNDCDTTDADCPYFQS